MKIRDKSIAVFIVLILGLSAAIWLMPSGLKHSPAITLDTIDGRALNLADFRGRPLLVTFWATSCPGCMKEMPHLVEMYRDLAPRGLEIIGVAMDYDPLDAVVELSKRRAIPYPIAHDTDAQAALAFGEVRLTPTTFLIAPNGRIVQQTIGEMDMKKIRLSIMTMLNSSEG